MGLWFYWEKGLMGLWGMGVVRGYGVMVLWES